MYSSVGRFRWRWRLLRVTVFFIYCLCIDICISVRESESLVTRIAFGSCSNQSAPQPIWDAILDFNPDVFIWMGDNVYGDIRRPFRFFGKERNIGPWKNAPRFVPSSEEEMRSRYELAKTNPGYSKLRKKCANIVGTWDDHDYGLNDAGKEFAGKVTNQKLMLDFLDEPEDSPRRKQAGVYTSYTFGPTGKQVKVILLDTRYHRDPYSGYGNGTILGASQWAWLEKELFGPPTAITIIVSSIQVLSNFSAITGPFIRTECWARFPKERDRLFKLITDSKRDGVVFTSGDVHFGEISRYDCAVGYPLYDITSSGLTQSVEGPTPYPLRFIVRFLAWITPATLRMKTHNCRYKSCTYTRPNFGAIEINWDSAPVMMRIELRDVHGFPTISLNVSLSELRAGKMGLPVTTKVEDDRGFCTLEAGLHWIVRYRMAVVVFSMLALLLLALVGLVYAIAVLSRRYIRKCKSD